jgi:hypothetical protein
VEREGESEEDMNLPELNALPSAVWAILGSVITGVMSLIAVALTNRANAKRQAEEIAGHLASLCIFNRRQRDRSGAR